MRRGLLSDLHGVFQDAIGMLGGGDPAGVEPGIARYKALHKEVVEILRAASLATEDPPAAPQPAKEKKPGAVTADDRALAALLLETLRPEAAKDKQSLETVAKVLSTLHDRAVSCAAVRVEREGRSREPSEGPIWYLKNEKDEYLSNREGWVKDRAHADRNMSAEQAHVELIDARRVRESVARYQKDRGNVRVVRVGLRVRS